MIIIMGMEWAALATFVSVCCASTAGLIHSIQQSRCTVISCCFGLFSCHRKVPDIEITDENPEDATVPPTTTPAPNTQGVNL